MVFIFNSSKASLKEGGRFRHHQQEEYGAGVVQCELFF
jgi:hypothetical protein